MDEGRGDSPPVAMAALQRKLKSLEDLLVCPVCLDQYNDPKSLACLHALCRKCIQSMVDMERRQLERSDNSGSSNTDGIMVTCPACRQRSLIPSSDPRNLPDNFMVKNMLDALCRSDSQEAENDTSELTASGETPSRQMSLSGVASPPGHVRHSSLTATDCGNCGDDKQVTDVCQQCNMRLCRLCSTVHRKQLASRSHVVVPIGRLSPAEQRALRVRPPNCARHPAEPQEFHCDTCSAMICRDCALFDHRMHEFVRVEEHAERLQNQLVSCHEKLAALLPAIPEHTAGIKTCMQVLESDARRIKQHELWYIDSLVETLRQKRRAMEQAVVHAKEARMHGYRDDVRVLAEQAALGEELVAVSNEVQKANRNSTAWDRLMLLDQLQSCQRRIEEVLKETGASLPPASGEKHVELTFGASKISAADLLSESGTLTVRQHSPSRPLARRYILKAPDVSHTAWTTTMHIVDTEPAAMTAGTAAACQCTEDVPEIKAYLSLNSSAAEDKERTSLPIEELENGARVININIEQQCRAILSVECNGAHIRGSPTTIDITGVGKTLRIIGSRGNGDHQFKDPYDITVSHHNNHIFVADTGNHRVQELSEDGTFIQSIKFTAEDGKSMKPTAVAATRDGRLVVADYNHKCLLLFDNDTLIKVLHPPDNRQRRNRSNPLESGGGSHRGARPLECYGLVVDNAGRILATDYVERSILVFSPDGVYLTCIGYRCQMNLEARAESPQPVNPKGPLGIYAALTADKYYVADFGYYRVSVLDSAGKVLELLASRLAPSPDGSAGGDEPLLKRPWGIWCDSKTSRILVSDHTTNQLLVFHDGHVTSKLPADGDVAQRLNGPVGIAPDKYGRIWVVEREAHRIRLF
ncbi:RING finger protein nhl-1-like [Sycon ciliatum]|uniref:RING finger protein nhl-1-like n=1 Tax=Sycon ciliatum TaxID=27933 RepID=UPI0031F64AE1